MNCEQKNMYPASWEISTLGTVYDVVGGGTPSTAVKEYWKGDIPWITSADINGIRSLNVTRFVSEKGIEKSTTNKVPERTLLVVTRVGLGKIAISSEPICFSQDLQGLVQDSDLILPEYSLYFLSAELQRLKFEGRGTTISGLTKKQLKDSSFPLAPFNEQRRIVSKIEELFSELDNGIESLKNAREQLKVYRQAVLKHAFEGKLTADWREQNKDKLEPADQLLARIKTERKARYQQQLTNWKAAVKAWEVEGKQDKKPAKPKKSLEIIDIDDVAKESLPDLPNGWTWLRLSHVAEVSGGLTKNPKRNAYPHKMKYLRVANVYADRVLTDEIYEIGVTDAEAKKLALKFGDLLVVEGNGSVDQIGRVAMWAEEVVDCGHQNHLIRVRVVTSSLPRFFLQFLLSPLGRKLIVKEASSTSGLHTLSISKVSNLAVPITTPTEESAVLNLIEEKLLYVDRFLKDIDQQLQKSDSLRQSILKKAFSGQLVEQDPNDEPASVLLERIKAEKAAQAAITKKIKRKKSA